MYAAIEEAKLLEEGKRLVVIFPDSIRNYMTRHLSDDWMCMNGLLDEKKVLDNFTPKLVPNRAWGQEHTVGDLPLKKSDTVSNSSTISEAIKALGTNSEILVINEDSKVVGIFNTTVAMDKISKGKIVGTDNVTKSISKVFRKASRDIPLSELSRIFTLTNYVVVDEESIVRHHDLLNFFVENS